MTKDGTICIIAATYEAQYRACAIMKGEKLTPEILEKVRKDAILSACEFIITFEKLLINEASLFDELKNFPEKRS